eukprot:6276649-Pyramimonas_sp.AAC.2
MLLPAFFSTSSRLRPAVVFTSVDVGVRVLEASHVVVARTNARVKVERSNIMWSDSRSLVRLGVRGEV